MGFNGARAKELTTQINKKHKMMMIIMMAIIVSVVINEQHD